MGSVAQFMSSTFVCNGTAILVRAGVIHSDGQQHVLHAHKLTDVSISLSCGPGLRIIIDTCVMKGWVCLLWRREWPSGYIMDLQSPFLFLVLTRG